MGFNQRSDLIFRVVRVQRSQNARDGGFGAEDQRGRLRVGRLQFESSAAQAFPKAKRRFKMCFFD